MFYVADIFIYLFMVRFYRFIASDRRNTALDRQSRFRTDNRCEQSYRTTDDFCQFRKSIVQCI